MWGLHLVAIHADVLDERLVPRIRLVFAYKTRAKSKRAGHWIYFISKSNKLIYTLKIAHYLFRILFSNLGQIASPIKNLSIRYSPIMELRSIISAYTRFYDNILFNSTYSCMRNYIVNKKEDNELLKTLKRMAFTHNRRHFVLLFQFFCYFFIANYLRYLC